MKTSLLNVCALAVCITLGLATESQAQRPELGTPDERATRLTAAMKENLNLSAEQEVAVNEVNRKYARQNQTLFETGGRNLRTAREVQSQMKKKDEELKRILNGHQYKQYLSMKEELKREFRERRPKK